MTLAPALSVADRFALIIGGLCRAFAARTRPPNCGSPWNSAQSAPLHPKWGPNGEHLLAGAVAILIWNRLSRMTARFAKIAAHIHAGTLPKRRARKSPTDKNTGHTSASCPGLQAGMPSASFPGSPLPRLPRAFGWLVRLVPVAACYRSQLLHLLSDPEFATLLPAAPQVGRILRPLCWMLAIRLPESLEAIKPAPELLPKPSRWRPCNRPASTPSLPRDPPPDPLFLASTPPTLA